MRLFFLCAALCVVLQSCDYNDIASESQQDLSTVGAADSIAHRSNAGLGTNKRLLTGLSEQALRGYDIYQYWCATCHGRGHGKPGTMALGVKYEGDLPALLEHREDLPEDVLTYFIRNGISVMPSFRPTEVSDQDISDMAEYLAASSKYQADQNK